MLWPGASTAQSTLRVIESGSTSVRIVDDGDVAQGQLVDGLDPDTYVYHPSPRTKHLSMITDRGRADFVIAPGESVDFAVRLRGRLYHQRFAPIDPTLVYQGAATAHPAGVDTIPFRLGANNAIHIAATINGSQPLDLIFDTGASVGVLTEAGEAKGASILDGARNSLQIGPVRISGLRFVHIGYRGPAQAEGIIGFNAFAGRVVEIDYDRMILNVSAELPARRSGYGRAEFVWRGQNSLVPLSIDTGGARRNILALFDTGSRWSLTLSNRDPPAGASETLAVVGSRSATKANGTRIYSDVVNLPSLSLAGFTLHGVQADIEQPGAESNLQFNLIGNDFLKRFNMIIDYRTGELYLRPNHLVGAPYNPVFDRRFLILAGGLATLFVLAVLIVYRRRHGRLKKSRIVP